MLLTHHATQCHYPHVAFTFQPRAFRACILVSLQHHELVWSFKQGVSTFGHSRCFTPPSLPSHNGVGCSLLCHGRWLHGCGVIMQAHSSSTQGPHPSEEVYLVQGGSSFPMGVAVSGSASIGTLLTNVSSGGPSKSRSQCKPSKWLMENNSWTFAHPAA